MSEMSVAELKRRVSIIRAAKEAKRATGSTDNLHTEELRAISFEDSHMPPDKVTKRDRALRAATHLHSRGLPITIASVLEEMGLDPYDPLEKNRLYPLINILRKEGQWPYTLDRPQKGASSSVRSSEAPQKKVGRPGRAGLRVVPDVQGCTRRDDRATILPVQPTAVDIPPTFDPEQWVWPDHSPARFSPAAIAAARCVDGILGFPGYIVRAIKKIGRGHGGSTANRWLAAVRAFREHGRTDHEFAVGEPGVRS